MNPGEIVDTLLTVELLERARVILDAQFRKHGIPYASVWFTQERSHRINQHLKARGLIAWEVAP